MSDQPQHPDLRAEMDNDRSPTIEATIGDAARSETAPKYLEVWGDTVVGRHLAVSVLLGSGISVGALLIATPVFASFVENESLAEAYALLVGIAFCVVSGVVCGKLFRPKRVVATDVAEGDAVGDVIAILQEERQGLGSIADLPAATVKELEDLDLYDRFAAASGEATVR